MARRLQHLHFEPERGPEGQGGRVVTHDVSLDEPGATFAMQRQPQLDGSSSDAATPLRRATSPIVITSAMETR